MNFIEYVCDQEKSLRSTNYVKYLYAKIKELHLPGCSGEEHYRNHLPVNFSSFLSQCLGKARELHDNTDANSINWKPLNDTYVCTLIWYVLDNESSASEDIMCVAHMYITLNGLQAPGKHFFYKPLYLRVLHVLKDNQDSITGTLLDDFRAFLTVAPLTTDDVIHPTLSVLHDLTFCCTQEITDMSNISTSSKESGSSSSLGYKAFTCLQMFVEILAKQNNADKKLFPVLLLLGNSLNSSLTNGLTRSVLVNHQNNVRTFIRQNIHYFACEKYCLLNKFLKYVCFTSQYDEHEAISRVIFLLPLEPYQEFIKSFTLAMTGNVLEFRKSSLNYILPLLQCPARQNVDSKRQICNEIFVMNTIRLLVDHNEEVRYRCLRILAGLSWGDERICAVLKRIMSNEHGDINRTSIWRVLNKMTDKTWRKKSINSHYVQFVCNLFCLMEESISAINLNNLGEICIAASPNDLKHCIPHLKRVLVQYGAIKSNVVLTVVNIFVKQLFHQMATSAVFAKELHLFIFTNMDTRNDDDYVWNVVNYLVSDNFDVHGVFEKLNSLQLLKRSDVRILMEKKILQTESRCPALKLLSIMLNFVTYTEHQTLDRLIELSLPVASSDLYLAIYALNKILERIVPINCNVERIEYYRQQRSLISSALFDYSVPVTCIKHVIALLINYSHLLNDDIDWGLASGQFQTVLSGKLDEVLETKLDSHLYMLRDAAYVGELITLCQQPLRDNVFVQLKKLVIEPSDKLKAYFKKHTGIWNLCVMLYIKNCFINSKLIPECVSNMDKFMQTSDEYLKLQVMYSLLDICNMHLQYYDPIIPYLFTSLYNKNPYVRFIASKIIMKQVNNANIRLFDGQYYLFMGLLADEVDIVARNMESYVQEKYVVHSQPTIARHFVSGIIHYNLFYDHPSINLTSDDQNLLKKRIYSLNDRFSIYYRLFHYLAESAKLNIMLQISNEILSRIINKSLPISPEIFQILEDSLIVVLCNVPADKMEAIEGDDCKLYQSLLKRIEQDLLVHDLKALEVQVTNEQSTTFKRLLSALFELLYDSGINENAKMCQNLFFTIIVLTNNFYTIIKRLIHESGSTLKSHYTNVSLFYDRMKAQFEYCLVSVNPCTLRADLGKRQKFLDTPECMHFASVPPTSVLGHKQT